MWAPRKKGGHKQESIASWIAKYIVPAAVSAGVFFWLMPKGMKTPVTIEKKADTAPPPLVNTPTAESGGPRAQAYLSQIDASLHNLMAAQHSVRGGSPTSILDTAIANARGTASVVADMAAKDLAQGGITPDDLSLIQEQANGLLDQAKS